MDSSIGRSASRVGSGILLSRILGLVREQVFAFILGAGKLSDAFIVAFRIPNLLRDLFAEGAFSQAFVPVFSGILVNQSREKAYEFANKVLMLLILVVGAITLLAYLFTTPLVQALMPVADKYKLGLTVFLTRVILPFLLFVSLASVFMGMLNSQKHYFVPAMAPAVFNVISILAGLTALVLKADPVLAVIIWTFGALLGGAGQLVIQFPSLIRLGFRLKPSAGFGFKDENVRKLFLLMGPSIIGVAAVEVNIFINTMLATSLGDGAVTWLNYAFRLIQLPIGLFGVAIGTVNIVNASRAAAANDMEAVKDSLASSLRLNFFLALAATAGLVALGKEIVSLLFEHGRFQSIDTLRTYDAILFYCVGLFAYSAVKVTAPVYFALSNPRIPVMASISAVAANLVVSFSTYRILGVKGLALGTAVGACVNFGILLLVFNGRYGGMPGRKVVVSFFLSVLAALVVGSALFAVVSFGPVAELLSKGFFSKLAVVGVLFVFAVFLYFSVGFLFRIKEAGLLFGVMARMLSRLSENKKI